MKTKLLLAALACCLAGFSFPGRAAAAEAAASGPSADLGALVAKIRERLQAGKAIEADFKGELAEFDALLAKYKDDKSDDVAQILAMKATLYLEVFDDYDTGISLLKKVQADFPATQIARDVGGMIEEAQQRLDAKKKQQSLVGQPAPALDFQWASRDGLETLADLKGKVVVLDFWATWCGPCVASFPEVRALVDHYKGFDVEVVGVTSIQGRVVGLDPQMIDCRGDTAKELGLMPGYIAAKNVTWTVAFSKEDVFDPDYGVIGIPYMAILAPDGTVRHTGLHPAGVTQEEKVKMIDALLKEFGLKTPAA